MGWEGEGEWDSKKTLWVSVWECKNLGGGGLGSRLLYEVIFTIISLFNFNQGIVY